MIFREKNLATGTFVYRHIYIAKMPIFSTKTPDFMKKVIKRLNVSVIEWVKACWKAESPNKSMKHWKLVKKIFSRATGAAITPLLGQKGRFGGPCRPPKIFFPHIFQRLIHLFGLLAFQHAFSRYFMLTLSRFMTFFIKWGFWSKI